MRKFGKLVTTVLASAMVFHTTAMAAPMDELNEILANQTALQQKSLLSETLGLTELGNAIKENGISFDLKGSLTEGTAATLGMEGEIPEDGYAELGFQVDLDEKQWLLTGGFGTEGVSMGDLALYGSSDRLSLSIPQFFVGAVSLYAGNLKEQYAGSALEMMIGQGSSESVPEINTRFYPEPSDLEALTAMGYGTRASLLEMFEEVRDRVRVEKTEDAGSIIYIMTIPMEAVLNVYSNIFDSYLSLASQTGAVETTDLYELEEELDQLLDQMSVILPETFDMDFHTKDGLVEKITYELYMDTSELAELAQMEGEISSNTQSAEETETVYTDVVIGEVEEAGIASFDEPTEDMVILEESADGIGVSEEVMVEDDFKGTISYEILYLDPANPSDAMDINMVVTEAESGESVAAQLQLRTIEEGNTEEKTITMDVTAMKESVYSGTIYKQTFNRETGDFDVNIGFEDELEGVVAVNLDSTFTEIEAGKSFTWTLDGLTMEVEGESIGVAGEVSVSADPGEIAAPSQERVILDLTEEELTGLLMEVMQNAQVWASQFAPETEGVYDNGEYDAADEYDAEAEYGVADEYDAEAEYNKADDSVSEEIVVGEEAVSIIGGADGPTSVFVAGKVS